MNPRRTLKGTERKQSSFLLQEGPLTSIHHASLIITPGVNPEPAPRMSTSTMSVAISNKQQVSKLVGMGLPHSVANSSELTQALGIITNTVSNQKDSLIQRKNASMLNKTNFSARPKS